MSDEQIKNFILLVDTMRAKQKVYFRGRMGRDIEAAKKIERGGQVFRGVQTEPYG